MTLPLLALAAFVSVAPLRAGTVELQVKDESTTLHTICSGVVVGSERMTVLTEEHCLPEDGRPVFVDGVPTTVLVKNRGLVALDVHGRHGHWRAVRVRSKPPQVGEAVFAAGFAYSEFFAVQRGEVAGHSVLADEGPMLWLNLEVIAGQSGGPIVDAKGRLVSLVRMSRIDGFPSPNGLAGSAEWADLKELMVLVERARAVQK